MNNDMPIIDVTPVNHSRTHSASTKSHTNTRASSARMNTASSQSAGRTNPFEFGSSPFAWYASSAARPQGTSPQAGAGGNATSTMTSLGTRATGLLQMAAGAGLVMMGVPMLILPGPGLLSILGGFALAANGFKKLFA